VEVGAASDDLFPVSKGLAAGDKVVLNGNFLIDSQAHLSSGMSGLYGGSKEFDSGKPDANAASGAKGSPEQGAIKVDFHADVTPVKGGQDTPFHVTLTDAAGKPVSDAKVTVTLIMPAMPSMGMPEMKNSFELPWMAGMQMYMGKGQAPMGGTWNVFIEARRNGNVIATSHTHLSAE
jgi:hypothetical protein